MPPKGQSRSEQELASYRATVAARRAARTEKRCPRCEVTKNIDQFYPKGERISAYCIPCDLADQKRFRLKRIDMTPESYAEMLAAQGGGCAICGRRPIEGASAFPVDHDHETGETRGILCDSCNRGIGLLQDSVRVLLSAARYLGHAASDAAHSRSVPST